MNQTRLKLERARQRSTPLHTIGLDLRLFNLEVAPGSKGTISTSRAGTVKHARTITRLAPH
jgi:hypothetical protein